MPSRLGWADGDNSRAAYEPKREIQPMVSRVAAVPATAEPRSMPNRYHRRVKATMRTSTSGTAEGPLS